MRPAKNLKGGFTLIELLVVISIIAILAIIGMIIYGSVLSKARDTKRRSDIDAIASALEQRYNPYTHIFPKLLPEWFQSGIPEDPKYPDKSYTGFPPAGGVESYVICAQLDNKNGNASNPSGANASGDEANYYCRKNLQAF